MTHRERDHAATIPVHQGREEAVLVREPRQVEPGGAPEQLDAAACVGSVVIEPPTPKRKGHAREQAAPCVVLTICALADG
jgi:hypothetical protein